MQKSKPPFRGYAMQCAFRALQLGSPLRAQTCTLVTITFRELLGKFGHHVEEEKSIRDTFESI